MKMMYIFIKIVNIQENNERIFHTENPNVSRRQTRIDNCEQNVDRNPPVEYNEQIIYC